MDCLLCYHVLLMVFGAISFCLLWVGFATPGWLVVTYQEKEARREWTVSSLNRSLWYDILCPQELYNCDVCTSAASGDCVEEMAFPNYTWHYNWTEDLTSDKESWVLWRVLMTISVVFCCLGFIFIAFLICCRLRTKIYRGVATIAFFLWLVPAIFVWVPVAMDANMNEDIKETVNKDIPHDSTLHVPYSIVIAAVGAFMALIVALMLLWLTGVCSRRKDKSDRDSLSYSDNSRTKITEQRVVYGPETQYQHVTYGPHMYPYYIREQQPSQFYYQDYDNFGQRWARPTEEVVTENPRYTREIVTENPQYARVIRSTDDRSGGVYSMERWFDNKSMIDDDRK